MEERFEPVEQTVDTGAESKPGFDEILKDKDYQSEFDRRVTKAIETAKEKWTQKDTDADGYKREIERYRYREAALKMGIPFDMIDYAVYAAEQMTGEDTTFESALNSLITDKPWLADKHLPTTGLPQTTGIPGKSGVEKAFATLNPRIKI